MKHLLATSIALALSLILLGVVKVAKERKEYDCRDFGSQREAQTVFEKYSFDRYKLDADGDNKACE